MQTQKVVNRELKRPMPELAVPAVRKRGSGPDYAKISRMMREASLEYEIENTDKNSRQGKSARLRNLVEQYINTAGLLDLDNAIVALEHGLSSNRKSDASCVAALT